MIDTFLSNYNTVFKSSKLRIILTIIGISLGGIIFLTGKLLTESLEYNMMSRVEEFDEDTIIYNDISENSFKYISRFEDSELIVPFYREKHVQNKSIENIDYYITYDLIATSNYFVVSGIPFNNGDSISSVNLIHGRTWTNEEANNKKMVAVITKYTSEFLFATENSIGETIQIPNYGKFEVIGVIEDLLELDEQKKQVKFLTLENNDFYLPDLDTVIPLTTYSALYFGEEQHTINHVVQIHPNATGVTDAIHDANFTSNLSDLNNNFTRQKILNFIDHELDYYNTIFRIIFVVTLILSGFIIMNTMFFSIKERFFEIGVRVSAGASTDKIMIQFLTEVLILATISSVFCIVLINFISAIGNIFFLDDFQLVISIHSIVIYCLVTYIQSLLFGIIPAYYATKIDIIKALKFE